MTRRTHDRGARRKPPSRAGLTREDARLWRHAVRETRPLSPERAEGAPDAPAPESSPRPPSRKRAPATPAAKTPDESMPAERAAAKLRVGDVTALDRALATRLRRGTLAIDGTLDLHGMTRAEAHQALDAFVARAVGEGRRCLLVITGKGTRSGADDFGRPRGGVLRAAVPRWLDAPVARPHVLAVVPARPRHGGDGAFYVLIKRRRRR